MALDPKLLNGSRIRALLPSISFSVRIPKDRPNAHSGHVRKSSGRAEFVSSSPISRRAAPRTVGPRRAKSGCSSLGRDLSN